MNPQAEAIFAAGVEQYRSGLFEQAAQSLKQGLQLSGDNWQMRFFLAMSYARMDRVREAKTEFLSIRDCCPDPTLRERARTAIMALATISH